MRLILAALIGLLPLQSQADEVIDRVLATRVLPAVSDFAAQTSALAAAAKDDCSPTSPALRAAWNGAMDSWLSVQDLRFGPLEDGARRQVIAYWPDGSGHRPRALARILSGADPILQTPDKYASEPVSVRGLYAVEAMLYDPDVNGYGVGDPGCALVQAATADLAQVAADLHQSWVDDFAPLMTTAGPDNPRFLDPSEVRQVIFTALMVSVQFDIDERLGLPMGSFDKPRPLRAEGRLSGRAQRNLDLSFASHQSLATALVSDEAALSGSLREFARLRSMVSTMDDPDFSGVSTPAGRFKLEALQTGLGLLTTTMTDELSAALGVKMGLNALDGD